MTFHHGVKLIEVTEGARPITTQSTSVIGLVATADDADVTFFPLNTVVEITDDLAIAKAGLTGTLAASLRAIFAKTRTIVHVVRVAHSAVADTLAANVIGTVNGAGARTGMQALLTSQSRFGYKPKILGTPGLESQAVTEALAALANKLNAFAYASALGPTNGAAIGYRANFSARELMLITPDIKTLNAAALPITTSAIATALGQRAWIDQNIGWHKTISNVEVSGILGLSREIDWNLQSMDNDAGILNQADITTIIRRDGYRFWGSRTCSAEPKFAFESAVRTAQVLREMADDFFWAIDKPLTPGLAKDIVSSLDNELKTLTRNGYLLGGGAWFDPARNPAEQLAAGILDIDYDYTPVPPLEALHLTQRITERYYGDFAARLAA
jgi:uncharacterized protein